MDLIAIDPGIVTGYAVFQTQRNEIRLTECGITKEKFLPKISEGGPFRIIVECPQPRHSKDDRTPIEDKLALARTAYKLCGWYEAFGHHVAEVYPSHWKKQLDKDTCWRLILNRLDRDECGIVSSAVLQMGASYVHNMRDAIGIGMYGAGRFRL